MLTVTTGMSGPDRVVNMHNMRFSFLKKNLFPLIHRTFLEAFSDYQVDMSYITEEVMFKRAVKNAAAFKSSVGVFDDDRMVGFTLIGIDNWQIFYFHTESLDLL